MSRVIGVQFNIAWEDKPANFERVRRLLSTAPIEPESLIVLPEMFSTGFSMNVAGIKEGEERPAERFLASLARDHRAYVLGGVVNAGVDRRGRNQAVGFSPTGEQIVRYDKIQPFSLGKESEHYAAGDSIQLFDWQGFKVAPFVCYDLRFPEHFRRAAIMGAEVMIVIASWPFPRVQHWLTLLAARAIENQAYVVGINRCGADPYLRYPGRSSAFDPHGEAVGQAGEGESLLRVDLDRNMVTAWRRDFPALRDMRRF